MVKIQFSKKSNLFDNNDLTKTKRKIHIPQPTIDLEQLPCLQLSTIKQFNQQIQSYKNNRFINKNIVTDINKIRNLPISVNKDSIGIPLETDISSGFITKIKLN